MISLQSFQSFCDSTTLHGWGHLGQRQGSKLDKIIWLVTIIGSIVSAVLLLERVVKEYNDSTVIMKLQSSQVDVSEADIPHIIMKNVYRIRKSLVDSVVEPQFKDATGVQNLLNKYLIYGAKCRPY